MWSRGRLVTIPSTTASQGDTDRSVSVTICEDTVVEASETVTLQAADNAAFNNGGGDKMAQRDGDHPQ